MSNITGNAVATVDSAISELSSTLARVGVESPARAAADIVAALLEVPRSWTSLNKLATLDSETVLAARRAAEKLGRGAPFQYAVGMASFRHLNLVVDERVLIPRPETEVLVGEILDRFENRFGDAPWGTAIDIGTGSGAIALSLACEGRFEKVIATDASLDAVAVARENAARSRAAARCEIEFRHGSFLAPVGAAKASVIVSNPPYVAFSEAEWLPASVRDWEPALALFTGGDGMKATAEIVRDSSRYLMSGGLLALEVDERRASLVAELMMKHGDYRDVGVRLDLTGRERFVMAWRT
ncbi:MAG TPA: peptide chain release factor N(5)-glutamine methyltransferase [Gemmatimonadaceae bacterium]